MAEPSDILSRADSLMRPEGSALGVRADGGPFGGRRRRSFVAAPQPAPDTEPAAATEEPSVEEDDLPVLTEVVSAEGTVSSPPDERFDETLLAIIVADIAHSIEQQLAIELPTLVEASLLNVMEELRAGVSATVESALRDFLVRRRQLRLPLDDSDSAS
jgi:hypothetical protein